MKIILASASPRRKELLKLICEDFEVKPSSADETIPNGLSCENVAEYLATIKAKSIKNTENNTAIIGCDTVVVIDNKILGKPIDRSHCKAMLSKLSGRTHFVYTGVCIIYNNKVTSFTEKTEVLFHNLTENEVEKYMDTNEPFDKAGGYGIQGKGALLVKSIKGDYFNVVGLPVSAINRKLANL